MLGANLPERNAATTETEMLGARDIIVPDAAACTAPNPFSKIIAASPSYSTVDENTPMPADRKAITEVDASSSGFQPVDRYEDAFGALAAAAAAAAASQSIDSGHQHGREGAAQAAADREVQLVRAEGGDGEGTGTWEGGAAAASEPAVSTGSGGGGAGGVSPVDGEGTGTWTAGAAVSSSEGDKGRGSEEAASAASSAGSGGGKQQNWFQRLFGGGGNQGESTAGYGGHVQIRILFRIRFSNFVAIYRRCHATAVWGHCPTAGDGHCRVVRHSIVLLLQYAYPAQPTWDSN
jgi:hypothetical protein